MIEIAPSKSSTKDKVYEKIKSKQKKNIEHEIDYIKKLLNMMTAEPTMKNFRILDIIDRVFIESIKEHFSMLADILIFKEVVREDELSYGYDEDEGAWYFLNTSYKKSKPKKHRGNMFL